MSNASITSPASKEPKDARLHVAMVLFRGSRSSISPDRAPRSVVDAMLAGRDDVQRARREILQRIAARW